MPQLCRSYNERSSRHHPDISLSIFVNLLCILSICHAHSLIQHPNCFQSAKYLHQSVVHTVNLPCTFVDTASLVFLQVGHPIFATFPENVTAFKYISCMKNYNPTFIQALCSIPDSFVQEIAHLTRYPIFPSTIPVATILAIHSSSHTIFTCCCSLQQVNCSNPTGFGAGWSFQDSTKFHQLHIHG